MNQMGDVHANLCHRGTIVFTDYSDYQQNSYLYPRDPVTGIVDKRHFTKRFEDVDPYIFWVFLDEFRKDEIRSVNVCPHVQLTTTDSRITRHPCDACRV